MDKLNFGYQLFMLACQVFLSIISISFFAITFTAILIGTIRLLGYHYDQDNNKFVKREKKDEKINKN